MDVCTDMSDRGRQIKKEEEEEEEKEITILAQSCLNDDCLSGQLNLCNELEAKSMKFVLLATRIRYVSCLNYLCCFSRSHIDERFSNFATEV